MIQQQDGFSAIELLITLFIGFLFIAMGFQLYSVSTQGSEDSRELGMASNIAYEELRSVQARKTPTDIECTKDPQVMNSKPVYGGTAQMTTSFSCPFTDLLNIRLINVTIQYNLTERSVTHAMYINQAI